ncbi:MAG: Wzz/FepE/Etk N-terminal domain-containing protein, partial [Balneolales bacterium]
MTSRKDNGSNLEHTPRETGAEYRDVQVNNDYYQDDDEIDLIELAKTLWEGRRTIIITVVAFMALGLFIALGSSEEFTSEVKMMPESSQGGSLGGLGGLASQFGFGGMGGGDVSEGIPASLYPDITKSLPLMQKLMQEEINIPGENTTATIETYLTEMQTPSAVSTATKYTIGLPFTMIGWIPRGDDENQAEVLLTEESELSQIVRMSTEQWEVVENLRNRITASMDDQSGIVTVSVKMPDAEVAAEVTQTVIGFLREYIKDYNTEKAREDVEFIESRRDEALIRFEAAQENLARYRDENRGTLTELARTRDQRLQSESDLTFNVYSAMSKRLEEARITLQEDTPVVKILEPAAVPDKRSEPRRPLIMIIT